MLSNIQAFLGKLADEEKSAHTIAAYRTALTSFADFCEGKELTKETVVSFKNQLQEDHYKVSSINAKLAAVNGFLKFIGRHDCLVKFMRAQSRTFTSPDEELTRKDFRELLNAAEDDDKLFCILLTLGGTGIRVSELAHFTVEAVRSGRIEIRCKNKTREILLPEILQNLLLAYCETYKLDSGQIFVTSSGKPLDRIAIWRRLKRIGHDIGMPAKKVYPHNFRKLFARTIYAEKQDLALLADLLGHTSLNTSRIYIKSTGKEHRELLEKCIWD